MLGLSQRSFAKVFVVSNFVPEEQVASWKLNVSVDNSKQVSKKCINTRDDYFLTFTMLRNRNLTAVEVKNILAEV